jgi:hypothetical protein
VEYYRTEEGKQKKQWQNGKRGRKRQAADARSETIDPQPEVDLVGYVRMVTSLIEERRISRAEIVAMLARAVRQHSMARRRRIDYVLSYLRKNAP